MSYKEQREKKQPFKSFGKILTLLLAGILVSGLFAACNTSETPAPESGEKASESGSAEQQLAVHVGSLRGPTSIGLADFITKVRANEKPHTFSYEFNISGTADEILPDLVSGDVDIALIPANAASILYNKTEGGIQVLNINTLGVLHVVSADTSIKSFEDLSGKTVVMSGKGLVPELVMKHLLDKAGIADSVTLEFKSEPSEVAALLSEDDKTIAMLPEPYATSAVSTIPNVEYCLDLTEVWNKLGEGKWGQLITGVTVARTEFIHEHPDVIEDFTARQKDSVRLAQTDPVATAPKVVELGIVDKVDIAEKAIPRSNVVFIDSEELKTDLGGFLDVLFSTNPESIGGTLPADDFYYKGTTK